MSSMPPDPIPAAVRRDIETRLAAIEAEQDVRLLLAVESGSRAWGFPSPDSDYNVRFLYVRSRDWYLSLMPGRNVIETPIEADIDLNGWDIRKALGLLLKSNAVVNEWIGEPIRYRPDHAVVADLARLADAVLDPRALAHHYANLGRNAAHRWLAGDDAVPVKKYFYALRPALAIRCLRQHPAMRPPMNLQELMAAIDLPRPLAAQIDDLVEAKRRTNERANGTRLPDLDALIRDELAQAGDIPAAMADKRLQGDAERLFLRLVNA